MKTAQAGGYLVFRAFDVLKRMQREWSAEEAWNKSSIELCKAARVSLTCLLMHVRLYLVRNFLEKVATVDDSSLHSPLYYLTRLYVFDLISSSQGEFLKIGYYIYIYIIETDSLFYFFPEIGRITE
uniref:ACOX domain-containing protein n=1 Tax=Heterorhabditis bacteriophora TaxID=37862 RepID=A0A1I7W6Z9_HETBA